MVGNEPRLEPCWSVLLFGSLGAMWAWWSKPFHKSKCGSGHVCHHNKTSSMLYGLCDSRGRNSFTNALLHIDRPIWAKDFELWFVIPKDLYHCFIVQYLCPLVNWSLFKLFCLLNSGFFTTILLYRPASQSFLTVDVDTFFTTTMFGAITVL